MDEILWGSNYPQGDLNMSNVSFTTSNTLMPMVIDWDQDPDLQNEVIFFSGNQILLYDNKLNFLDSYSMENNIKGHACIGNAGTTGEFGEGDADFDLMIMDGANLLVLDSTGTTINLEKSVPLSSDYDSVICSTSIARGSSNVLICDDGSNGYCDLLDINSHALGTRMQISGRQTCGNSLGTNWYGNPYWVGDYDNDNNLEYGVAWDDLATGTDFDLVVLDSQNETFDLNISTTNSNLNVECNFYFAQIGDISSSKELIIEWHYWNDDSHTTRVYDLGGNQKFQVTGTNLSNMAVADIDIDGQNEACLRNESNYMCYTTVGIREYEFLIDDSNFNSEYISIGEYDNSNTWLEIIAPSEITQIENSAGDTTNIMDLGVDEVRAFTFPVEIQHKVPFKKDILVGTESQTFVYTTLAQPVCGNGICETGETTLTCLIDCPIAEEKDVVIDTVVINPSNSQIWKNNTDVQVDVTVLSKQSYPIKARAVLYEGSIWEDDKGFIDGNANTTISFTFKANHTITQGNLRVYGFSTLDNSTENRLFTFAVQLDGQELGDSTANFDFFEDNDQIIVDEDDNIAKDFIDAITGGTQGGLGYLGIWLLFMTVVTISLVFLGSESRWDGTVTASITIIANCLLLVFGTVLGFLPVGIIIVFSLFGILLGVLFWRKTATGG